MSVGEAEQMSPSLRSAWQACQSAGVLQRVAIYADEAKTLSSYVLDDYAERNAQAVERLLKEDPDVLMSLTNSDIGRLAGRVSGSGYKNEGLLEKIYQAYEPWSDIKYKIWENPKRIEFLQTLEKDPAINYMRQKRDSPDFGIEEKLALVDRVSLIQSRIYGYETPSVHLSDLSKSHPNLIAYFDLNSKRMFVDMTELSKLDFMDTLLLSAHENDHAFQGQMNRNYVAIIDEEIRWQKETEHYLGAMSPQEMREFNSHMQDWVGKNLEGGLNDMNRHLLLGGRLREMATAINCLTYTHYFHGKDSAEDIVRKHDLNPVEQQANDLESSIRGYFGDVGFGPGALRDNIIESLQSKAAYGERTESKDRFELSLHKFDTQCSAISPPMVKRPWEP